MISIDPPIISTDAGESDNSSRSYGIELSQSIYDHRNYTGLRAARTRSLQADATYDAANDALMIRTAEAYFNTLTAIDSLAFARSEERAQQPEHDADRELRRLSHRSRAADDDLLAQHDDVAAVLDREEQ